MKNSESLACANKWGNPLSRIKRARLGLVTLILMLAFFGLAIRLIQVQVVDNKLWLSRAQNMQQQVCSVQASRGSLLDRNAIPLAISRLTYSCYVGPRYMKEAQKKIAVEQLPTLLDIDVNKIRKNIMSNRGFVWIKRRCTSEQRERILVAGLEGVFFTPEWKRVYLEGSTASHLLWGTDIDDVGKGGVEKVYEEVLRPEAGSRTVMRDGRRKVLWAVDSFSNPAKGGKDIRLAIDVHIQRILDEQLAQTCEKWSATGGAVGIVMDVRNGDVLALSSYPVFDASKPMDYPVAARRNRAITDTYEPGSTFKTMAIAAAIDSGKVSMNDVFDCEGGTWKYGPRTLHDHHGYRNLSVRDILVHSSNIGVAKVALKLGMKPFYFALESYGFGRVSGIELPGEARGVLRHVSKWNKQYSMTSIPMGHEVSLTIVQLAAAYAGIVNGGVYNPPRLVSSVEGGDDPYIRQLSKRIISEKTSSLMVEALSGVVKEGTGSRAKAGAYSIGGKTGTTTLFIDGKYSKKDYVGSFVGFGPIYKPRLVCVIAVRKPSPKYYGGTVAAPYVGRVLEQSLSYLQVSPNNITQEIVQQGE